MTARVSIGGLKVAQVLYELVEQEIAPGTGIDPDEFWRAFGQIVHDLAPRNQALLAKRDELQAAIDACLAGEGHPGRGVQADRGRRQEALS